MNQYAPIEADANTGHIAPASRRPRRWLVAAVLAAVIVAGWFALRGGEAPAAVMPVPVVTVATPLQREVVEWDDYIGRFEASRSVELRPRVSGELTAVHFRDGQFVSRGQPLFSIDARPYQAALAESQAGVATARSDLALASADLGRALRLVAEDAVSRSEIDSLRAKVNAANASLAAAQARVRSRSLDVSFTTVRAPISGRISDRRIDPGNLVAAGDGTSATLLTTINAVDPVYFTFEGSEALFLKARRHGADSGTDVEIKLQDEPDYRRHGKLDFTDNGLDAHSGTMRARALVTNPGNFLTPGMFGNMRLASGPKSAALLVPDSAVVTDQTRKLLLVVGKDGLVSAKPVELGSLVGRLRVIRSGIAPGDRIIIEGVQSAAPGSKVRPQPGRITATAATATPAAAR